MNVGCSVWLERALVIPVMVFNVALVHVVIAEPAPGDSTVSGVRVFVSRIV